MSFKWPLAVSPFTFADKAAISWWLLTKDRYTMGEKVEEFESLLSEFSGMHALMVANGSVANQLVFELWKIKNPGVKPVVIVPAVTWVSSISPALMAGMDIEFCDINVTDLSLDHDMAENILRRLSRAGRRVILWPTALIGFCPDMARLQDMATRYGADLFLDSCENTFGRVYARTGSTSILASAAMTTTSCYMSHQITSIEGGFVFFRDKQDHDLGRMFRNHGLSRSLAADHPVRVKTEADNPAVDPQFLFALCGTNMRPTDVHAAFGIRDFKRAPRDISHRTDIYRRFHGRLDRSQYFLPPLQENQCGFCFCIFRRDDRIKDVKAKLVAGGLEVRPIIGGHLGYQPPFRSHVADPALFHNAEWVHRHGAYVGLHSGVSTGDVDHLIDILHNI